MVGEGGAVGESGAVGGIVDTYMASDMDSDGGKHSGSGDDGSEHGGAEQSGENLTLRDVMDRLQDTHRLMDRISAKWDRMWSDDDRDTGGL